VNNDKLNINYNILKAQFQYVCSTKNVHIVNKIFIYSNKNKIILKTKGIIN